jgi:hypothetical protein
MLVFVKNNVLEKNIRNGPNKITKAQNIKIMQVFFIGVF